MTIMITIMYCVTLTQLYIILVTGDLTRLCPKREDTKLVTITQSHQFLADF